MKYSAPNFFRALFFFIAILLFASLGQAADIDLQVSSCTVNPDPVINGGTTTFDLTVQNNGPAISGVSTLTITPPDNVSFSASADCSQSGDDLICAIAGLAVGKSASVSYTAIGNGAGVESTSATITIDDAVTYIEPVPIKENTQLLIAQIETRKNLIHNCHWLPDVSPSSTGQESWDQRKLVVVFPS